MDGVLLRAVNLKFERALPPSGVDYREKVQSFNRKRPGVQKPETERQPRQEIAEMAETDFAIFTI